MQFHCVSVLFICFKLSHCYRQEDNMVETTFPCRWYPGNDTEVTKQEGTKLLTKQRFQTANHMGIRPWNKMASESVTVMDVCSDKLFQEKRVVPSGDGTCLNLTYESNYSIVIFCNSNKSFTRRGLQDGILWEICKITVTLTDGLFTESVALVLDALLRKDAEDDWSTSNQTLEHHNEELLSPLMDVMDWLGQANMRNHTVSTWKGKNIDMTCAEHLMASGALKKIAESQSLTGVQVHPPTINHDHGHSALSDYSFSPTNVVMSIISMQLPAGLRQCGENRSSFMITDIVSVQFNGSMDLSVEPLLINFTCTFEKWQDEENKQKKPAAVFWNSSVNEWQTYGCRIHNQTSMSALVACNHTTNFAILMKPIEEVSQDDGVLGTVTSVGLALSDIFMTITALLHLLLMRYLRNGRTITIINLCIALTVGNSLFLFGVTRVGNKELCRKIAISLHYCYLAGFVAMLMEGLRLLQMLSHHIYHSRPICVATTFIITWGVPALWVWGTIVKSGFRAYENKYRCWLKTENGWIWYFIGPVCVIIVVNLMVMALAIRALLVSSVELEKRGKLKTSLWNVFLLVCILGVTWIFGAFDIHKHAVFFEYMFSILNSFQGCFLFLLTCVLDKKTRNVKKKKVPTATLR